MSFMARSYASTHLPGATPWNSRGKYRFEGRMELQSVFLL